MATAEMRGLIAELRANPWYMRLYFAQIAAWLATVIIYETAYAPAAPPLKHIIDGGVTMSFLAYGSLVSSVVIVDVTETAYQKGKELMGILLTPAKNKFEAIGEARGLREGLARGEARGRREGAAIMAARSAAWFADMQQAQKEGREFNDPPPWEQNGQEKDD